MCPCHQRLLFPPSDPGCDTSMHLQREASVCWWLTRCCISTNCTRFCPVNGIAAFEALCCWNSALWQAASSAWGRRQQPLCLPGAAEQLESSQPGHSSPCSPRHRAPAGLHPGSHFCRTESTLHAKLRETAEINGEGRK